MIYDKDPNSRIKHCGNRDPKGHEPHDFVGEDGPYHCRGWADHTGMPQGVGPTLMIEHKSWCAVREDDFCDCGAGTVRVPIELLRRVELALLLLTTEYAVKPMPTRMWNEVKRLAKEIEEITNG